jgi:hypothetical protein
MYELRVPGESPGFFGRQVMSRGGMKESTSMAKRKSRF